MNEPVNSSVLIANPHLNDPNFIRSVVFLCETGQTGSIGFVLNKKTEYSVNELIPDIILNQIPVYEGGPVEPNTLHFIHQYPAEIQGGKEVLNGVYWGGDFDSLVTFVNSGNFDARKIRFYLGYSGWGEGQLAFEMEEKSWIVAPGKKEYIFHNDDAGLWKLVLKQLGGEYELFVNAPLDPRLN